jgi:hypothetical protein
MDRNRIIQLRAKAAALCQSVRQGGAHLPKKARVVLGLFLVAAFLLAIYTRITATDSSLHLKVQHGFHSAQVAVWVDGDLAYSSTLTGSAKKRFGFLPSDSVQGTLSQIIPLRSGHHIVRVRISPDDGSTEDNSISGYFARSTQRDLLASARHNGLALSWQATSRNTVEMPSSSFDWFSRYAGSLLLTVVGSIISALTGLAIRELPSRLRSSTDPGNKVELGPQ